MSEKEETTTTEGGQQFQLQKIYLKDTSFETPNSPGIFTEKWEPEVNVEMQSTVTVLMENVYEVVLVLTVTAKVEDKTAFLVEVHQAGVFAMAGFTENEQGHMLGSYCPNLIFPYAREAVSDLVGKGGFPQLLLAPVNFDALYAQHLQQQAEEQSSSSTEEQVH
jgi:preprotein translocase subunit SecB